MKMKILNKLGRIAFYLCVICLVIYSIGPIIWMLLSSLRPKVEFFTIPPTFFPKTWTLENYYSLFRETPFVQFLLNSMWVSIGAILVSAVVGVMAAYSLARFNYRGRNLLICYPLSCW